MNELVDEVVTPAAYEGVIMPVIDCDSDDPAEITRWQVAELRRMPTEIKRNEGAGFDYLDIGYVQDEADHVFGVGNWGVIPGTIERIEGQTAKGDPKVTIVDRITVWVRFANGKVLFTDSVGIGEYFPNSPRANIAASEGTARSEAIKSGLRRHGNSMGRKAREQAAEIRVNMAADDLDGIIASKSMVFWSRDGDDDHLLTHEDIESVAQSIYKQPFTTLDSKKKGQVILQLKDRTISLDEYEAIKESVEAAGKTVTEGTSVAELKRLETEIRRRR